VRLLCARLRVVVRKFFEGKGNNRGCDKMVAFGLLTLCIDLPEKFGTPLSKQLLSEHASLPTIRDVYYSLHPDNTGEFKIYLQDPMYSKLNELVAASDGMEVLICSIGHQMGWVMVDESTFVVEFRACFPFYRLLLEITRPVGILTARSLEEAGELHDYNAYFYTLEENGKSVVVPGVGV